MILDKKNRAGMSLFEIIIGLALGVLLIGASVLGISFMLRSGKTNEKLQTANGLSKEMLEKVRTVASVNWNQIYTQNPKGANNNYYISVGTPLSVLSGSETVNMEDTAYSVFFTIENVNRNSSEDIVGSGGTEDPSTQKITVYVHWGSNGEVKLVDYITRWKNAVFVQTDWSGSYLENGTANPEVTNTSTARFGTSTGIKYSTNGEIELQGF